MHGLLQLWSHCGMMFWKYFMMVLVQVRLIHFEPMIDMPYIDYSCIYSSMSFVSDFAAKYDHDLLLAIGQQRGSLNKMVIMLGTFRTCVRFYISIGYMRAGSGIQSLLEPIYAEHILSHVFVWVRPLSIHLELI